MTPLRGLLGGFRARLVVAFALVVAIALGLVLATLPRLLDGYFAQQEQSNLDTRADVVAELVLEQLVEFQTFDTEFPRPILAPGEPLTASNTVFLALGNAREGYVHERLSRVAQADIEVAIYEDIEAPTPAYRLPVPFPDEDALSGQQREAMRSVERRALPDLYWTQTPAGAPIRVVEVTLARPFTFRAQTLEAIVGVLLGAAGLALAAAVVASLVLAARLTEPVRRLTQTSRALAEGQLDARATVPGTASPEVAELATAFNAMADRVQESIAYIVRDRDRSRDFLADVSHELRTPIAALRTFNELLQDGAAADPATREEFLDQSRQQIERLDWLATNLLEISKLDTGLVALDLRPEDVRAVVESAVQQAEPVARRKGVELVRDLPRDAVRQLHDPQRVGQILGNLIGNAVKFTAAGGRVIVSLRATEEGAELRVADTGVGIEADELPRVFDRFYRGARAHEERAAGSGLGLAIVRSVVEMHHGRIAIQSAPDKGTEVTVILPRDVSVSSPAPVAG